MDARILKFEHSLRSLLKESNPEEDENIKRKIIDVLQTEIRRLSGKGRETNKDFRPPAAHPQPNTTPNTTRPNNKAGLVSIRTVHPQNKINIITTPSNQANPDGKSSSTAGPKASTLEDSQDASSPMSMDDTEIGCNESSSVANSPGFSHHTTRSGDTSLIPGDVTNHAEQELQEVASVINEAYRIIVFVGAGISTNCGIPDFRSETGLHKTNRGLFEREVLDDEERRKELYKCLIEIRNKAKSEDLIQTDTHRFLQTLQRCGKLQRCYTQNLDGLEARAGLNADIESKDCDAVQLHGNLDSFRCSYCKHLTSWDGERETALASGELVSCPECASRVEERQRRGGRTNIHVGHLRPNIVLFQDIDDPLSEAKARIIDKDANSTPDVLLVVGTSLAIDGPRYELKNKLIPAVRRNGGKVIYVNNNPPPRAFSKPVVDHIFEVDCDYWVRDLAACEPSLGKDEAGHGSQRLSCGFESQPKAETVDEVIKEAELKLISIGDYSDVQFRTRTKEEVREDLSPFLPSNWLSTSPLMCVLSLFGWGESTTVLHSKHTEFDMNDVEKRKEMLDGPVWPIGRKHTRIIIPHNPSDHWILIVVDIPIRTISYYSSLPGYHLGDFCEFVEAQMKRVGEKLGQDYSGWNSPLEGSSHQQTNGSDCGIYLLENARRLSQGEVVNGAPIEADSLRVFYAELLLARSLHEASEQTMLKSVLYPETSRSWQVGVVPRSYAFNLDSTRAKRRKLQIEEVEAQTARVDESDSDGDEDSTRRLDLATTKANISTLFKSSPSCPWMKYLERFANCRLQRSKAPMGYARASRLLEMVAAFACPEHFVALKGAVAHYRVLAPEEVIQAPLDLSSHLYTVGVWTERLGLINVILQRFVRAYFTSLIDEGTHLSQDRAGHMIFQNGCTVTRSVKATVVKIYPKMKGWDSSTDPAERSAFWEVQRNLRRWRQEGAIWSLIQNRFSSLALLALVPHHVRILPASQSISGSSFQTEIPRDARALFVEALAELRPHLWSYVPKLAHLFDILSSPAKLKARQFKIELATDDEIRNAAPESTLLMDAFNYSNESNTNIISGSERYSTIG